ncbi:MAG: penicillin-binding protein 1B [Motiliproteus sp.]|nr:penicillin-binding protein 1B [Motiliproteus sp.]MCW9053097.1 penicillin-binding protein 1B [Motiliproteus sp.]
MAKKRSSPKSSSRGKNSAPVAKFSIWGLLFKLSLVGLVIGGVILIYLDATIRNQFEGKRWALPAKVYARPLELYAGQPISAADLKLELKSLGYQWVSQVGKPGQAEFNGDRVRLYTRGFNFADSKEAARILNLRFDGPSLASVGNYRSASIPLARLEPVLIGGIYPADNEDRDLVKLAQVPEGLIQALISTEDRSFYQHHGISFKGIARAMWSNLMAGRMVQGGSTLTQQLVKNFFLTQERSLSRKLVEAPMAMLLELHYDKDEILEAYLNEVYLGQAGSRAIHGFGLASHYYFGRPLQNLSLDQLSLLAGLVKGPSYYDPRRHPERAKKRRDLVIGLLQQQGHISAEEAALAQQRPLGVVPKKSLVKGAFPAYLDLVKRQLRKDYRQEDLASEGLQIFTNLDPIVQKKAETSLTRVSGQLLKRHGSKLKGLEGAMVVSNSQTGEVVAVVGGRNPRYQGFNRALDAVRPIGSLAKPAVFLAALEQDNRFNLSSRIDDQPLRLQNPDGSYWQPKNFDNKSHGQVPLHQALSRSYNLATARLGIELGMDRVVDTLERLGVERDIPPYPSTALGAVSLSPLEVMQLYQTIASNGFETPLRSIRSVLTAEGELLSSYRFELEQKFDPATVHLLQYALQETVREGTAKSVYNRFPSSLNLAGKTGTTNDQRDSWFAGFTGDYLAVAWLGLDNNQPTPLTGSTGALQVWSDLIYRLRPLSYQAVMPEGIGYHWIDDSTGWLTDEACPGARLIPFIEGTEPQQTKNCPQASGAVKVKNWFTRLFGG